ncbi:thioesterase [Aureibaculum marinum]|uniref:Thioesterase n=1 Tax=Aureibaculum marinum TaxID=2487930 RepID=A0A3N4PF71_9FLAO|nr:hotdog domain-containing protein [Aureibaculum marinum]RPD98183.1 thioesterase [Aureibaculum marinum]
MTSFTQNTHLLASKKLIGSVISITKNKAIVSLTITKEMVVDSYNLSHGSFTFGLADYAAMVAINKPTVVLGKAETKFLKPVILNDKLTAIAEVTEINDKKFTVIVKITNQKNSLVFEGNFTCFVLEKHVLEK